MSHPSAVPNVSSRRDKPICGPGITLEVAPKLAIEEAGQPAILMGISSDVTKNKDMDDSTDNLGNDEKCIKLITTVQDQK